MDQLRSLVGANIYDRLIEGHPHPVLQQLYNNPLVISNEMKVEPMIQAMTELMQKIEFKTADQIPPWRRLSTDCHSLDVALGGGIPVNGITEIYGSSGVGKTQIGLQLALTVQLPTQNGGLGKGALYICTEDVFPAKRLHELASHFKEKLDVDYEDNIYIEHISDYEQLRCMIRDKLPQLLLREIIGLIIIDSIAGLFRSENHVGNYKARGKQIIEIASCLHQLCDRHNIGIVCLNQVAHNIQEDKIVPCLGLVWSNSITYRCCVSRFESSPTRRFEIVFAPDLPNNKCSFIITPKGIRDSD